MSPLELARWSAARRELERLERRLAPLSEALLRLWSIQPVRVLIGPAGVEVETVWSPEAARLRDELEELRRQLREQVLAAAGFRPGEVPPEDPRRPRGS